MAGRLAPNLRRARRLWHEGRRFLAVAERREREGFEALRGRFFADYWADAARVGNAEIEDLGYGIFRIRRGGLATFVRGSSVMLDPHLALHIAGNKPLTHRLLAERGFPVPRHLEFDADAPAAAARFLAELDGRAVVKPAGGTGAGQGIATGLRDPRTLRRAVRQAATFSRRLLIEEEIPGSSYRLLYLGGELVDAIRRDPPTVEGDGRRSLRELIAAENARRLAGRPVTALHPIRPDLECTTTLRRQGRDLASVPARDERVVVKAACNENAARENRRIVEVLHPSIAAQGREIAGLLDLELAGLDLIAPKIDVPLAESGGVVNEINTTPGLHHHALVADPRARADVGPRILEHIFARGEARPLAAAWEAR